MFKFFKFNHNSLPPLKSLRPLIFDTRRYWFLTLLLFFVIILATGAIGFYLFYSGYFESYKVEAPTEKFENLVNVPRLKAAIEKRQAFIAEEQPIPKDPSSQN